MCPEETPEVCVSLRGGDKSATVPRSGSYLGGDYRCREAWTSDSLLQLGVPIFCARWYRSVSPK